MKKQEKEVLKQTLDNERELLRQMQQNYISALAQIKKEIKELKDKPDSQSRAYQIQYREYLESQINGYLEILESSNVETIQDYLNLCYETGYIGASYQLQGYGVGLVTPINQKAVLRATEMTADGLKLSTKIAGTTKILKKQCVEEIQRGFSAGLHFTDIARNISNRASMDMNRAMRIARTEGHRVQQEAAIDSAGAAAKAGVDVVLRWDAVLDARTRESHQRVDGEWILYADLGKKKFSNGLYYPGDKSAPPAETVNCRCQLGTLPLWEVKKDGPRLRRDNETGEIIECRNYAEYKAKYLQKVNESGIISTDKKVSGAISGALNPYDKKDKSKADKHAELFYREIRTRKDDVEKIAKSTGFSAAQIQAVKNFIFMDEHDLGEVTKRFDADFAMAQSWQRMIDGKPEKHDITMIHHEIYEMSLMAQGMSQDAAHILASGKYNYKKEAAQYYAKTQKHRKKG